jgi:hypothetical protein
MTDQAPPCQVSPSRWRNRLLAAALLVVLAAAAWLLLGRARPVVKWSAVAESLHQRQTMHGKGRIYLSNGTEYAYALWGRIMPRGPCDVKGMALPVRTQGQEAELPAQASPQLITLCNAMDYCGENGILTRLASGPRGPARARPGEWAGRAALVVDVPSPVPPAGEEAGYPDLFRLHIDTQTELVVCLELFLVEDGESKLRGRCDYWYDVALPPGFEEVPG